MFYIALVNEEDVFNAQIHCRQDMDVFHVEIMHEEGKIPFAQLSLLKEDAARIMLGKKVFLSLKGENEDAPLAYHLFSGIASGGVHTEPAPKGDGIVQITLMAESGKCPREDIKNSYRKFPFFDPLFAPATHQNKIYGLTEYWSKTLPLLKLKEKGGPITFIEIGDLYYKDTVRISKRCTPWKTIRGKITAEWVQQFTGLADISMALKSPLPEGLISTLTGDDLEDRWWKSHQTVKNSGYKILASELKAVNPPETGVLNMYPTLSAPFTINGHESTVPCQWFDPFLLVEWRYRQKRREILEFTVRNEHGDAQGEEEFHWNLQDITEDRITPHWVPGAPYDIGAKIQYGSQVFECTHGHQAGTQFLSDQGFWTLLPHQHSALGNLARGSFFTLERGQQAYEHALFQIYSQLQDQYWSLEMKFEMDFMKSLSLEIGEGIIFQDPHDPQKTLCGKVLSHTLSLEGEMGATIAHVTIGLHPEGGAVCQDTTVGIGEGFSGVFDKVFYKPFNHQFPLLGILDPQALTPHDLVTDVIYKNLAPVQNGLIFQQNFANMHQVQGHLNDHRTAVQIQLKDLISSDVLEHTLHTMAYVTA